MYPQQLLYRETRVFFIPGLPKGFIDLVQSRGQHVHLERESIFLGVGIKCRQEIVVDELTKNAAHSWFVVVDTFMEFA